MISKQGGGELTPKVVSGLSGAKTLFALELTHAVPLPGINRERRTFARSEVLALQSL